MKFFCIMIFCLLTPGKESQRNKTIDYGTVNVLMGLLMDY